MAKETKNKKPAKKKKEPPKVKAKKRHARVIDPKMDLVRK